METCCYKDSAALFALFNLGCEFDWVEQVAKLKKLASACLSINRTSGFMGALRKPTDQARFLRRTTIVAAIQSLITYSHRRSN